MWRKGVMGVTVGVVGIVWILQGTNVIRGSGMSGHGLYAVLGIVLVVIGATLLEWTRRLRRRHSHQ